MNRGDIWLLDLGIRSERAGCVSRSARLYFGVIADAGTVAGARVEVVRRIALMAEEEER